MSRRVSVAAEIARITDDARLDMAKRGTPHYVEAVLGAIAPEARQNGVSRSERTAALALFDKSVMESQRKDELLAAWLDGFGFASEQQAREAAALWYRHQSVTIEQAERDAVRLLKDLMSANPSKRAEIRETLFGEVQVYANGNGHTNGNGAHA